MPKNRPVGVARTTVAVGGVVRRSGRATGGRAPGQRPRGVGVGAAAAAATVVAAVVVDHGGGGRRKLEHGT